jgi:hypothetical protein
MATDASAATDGSASPVTSAPTATDTSPTTGEPGGAASEREPPSWDEVHKLRAEARRHRLTKVAVESERDELRTRLDQHERREVERQIADRVQSPADFWLTTTPSDLRDPDTGELDSERVNERLDALLQERPHWAKAEPGLPSNFSSGVRKPIQKPKTIGEAFKSALHSR